MASPTGDVLTTGWAVQPPGPAYAAVDEAYASLDLADYLQSNLPAVLTLAFPGGGAASASGSVYLQSFGVPAQVLAELLDSSNNVVATGLPTTIPADTGQLVTAGLSPSAAWTRMRLTITAQSDAVTFNDAAMTFNDMAVSFTPA